MIFKTTTKLMLAGLLLFGYILLKKFPGKNEASFSFRVNPQRTGVYKADLKLQQNKLSWQKFRTGGKINSSALMFGNNLFFGSNDGNFYNLDVTTGMQKWKFKTDDAIVSSPAIYDNTVYFGSHDGYFYAVNASSGRLSWKYETEKLSFMDSSPAITDGSVYFGSFDKNLYALDAQTGKEKWKFATGGIITTATAIDNELVYASAFDGNLYVVNISDGKEKWRYETNGAIASSPVVFGNLIFLGNSDGNIYAINAFNTKKATLVTESSSSVDQYGLYELTIERSEEGIDNPWQDVDIVLNLTDAEGEKFAVNGFYYRPNIWKVRFSPHKFGTWKWQISFKTPTYSLDDSGSFFVNKKEDPGAVKISDQNHYRLVFEDGSLFNAIGINNGTTDLNKNGYPLDDWGLDGKLVGMEDYMKAYGSKGAGFNLFRWSVDNFSFKLWEDITPKGNHYLVKEGLWGDELVNSLRNNGFRIWLTMFGFDPPFKDAGSSRVQQEAIKQYLKYVVARYGAYTDIWELMNEATVSDGWSKNAAEYLRSVDPYKHPITTNWEKPDLPEIEINSLHWYDKESEFDSDLLTVQKIQAAKKWGKPVIFSEQGNKGKCWDDRSAIRMRLRSWTAFFNEGILIFWNSTYDKNYAFSYEAANLYIGQIERSYIKSLQNFTSNADVGVKIIPLKVNSEDIRSYGLESPYQILGYLHHFKSHTANISTSISLNLPARGKIQWVDPSSGKILKTEQLESGLQEIKSPEFIIDLAFKIELSPKSGD